MRETAILPNRPVYQDEYDYLTGVQMPHYPVPALIGTTFIFDDYVCITSSENSIDWLAPIAWDCWRD